MNLFSLNSINIVNTHKNIMQHLTIQIAKFSERN